MRKMIVIAEAIGKTSSSFIRDPAAVSPNHILIAPDKTETRKVIVIAEAIGKTSSSFIRGPAAVSLLLCFGLESAKKASRGPCLLPACSS